MEEVPEEVPKTPEEAPKTPEEVSKTPEKVPENVEKKKRSKVIEARIEEETPQVAPPESPKPKRTGRPVGSKDSKPRLKKVEQAPIVAPSVVPPSDPVQGYLETKRMAAERAYQAQGEHWSNLLSHLM